jgi:TRAP-type mannitol/chloroaromatic compound transport system permease small subunit
MNQSMIESKRALPDRALRVFAWTIVATMVAFLVNVYLTMWQEWPGVNAFFEHIGSDSGSLVGNALVQAWVQVLLYPLALAVAIALIEFKPSRSLYGDYLALAAVSAYIVRAAFWAVLLVGIADMVISFMRVEGILARWFSAEIVTQLGRSSYRGATIHYPLIALSLVIAAFSRTIGFHWLALLVVVAEFQIVLARFIFSYEQAFMGDLVRFWYAALFLFASSYTLIHEGHVRVDVVYAYFSERGKAWANLFGSLLLGIPICWIILARGMSDKTSVITKPILSFEISQSGFGMYTKYLMAGFLLIYAVSMMVQFSGYFLRSAAVLRGESLPKSNESPIH